MKPDIVPKQREIELGENDLIVSKTDLQGRLTYANRKFMRIADYSERDLIGVHHNILLPPDMPRGSI
jgi:PAS domain S-box-containing protein